MASMDFQDIDCWDNQYPFLIAGPCSAESEEQVLLTARALKNDNISLFRAGIWKPRTRPGSFEGIGRIGLSWLRRVKEEVGLPVCTEVAKPNHVDQVLAYDIDTVWIGARTTANPFSIDELAQSIKGTDLNVWIKNPTNPDYKLWLGAIERLYAVGIRKIGVIHRGFSSYHDAIYRNAPMWQIPLELKRMFPGLKIICDHSHISGKRDLLSSIAQYAMDLQYDGLMTEVHPYPERAWSDARQQITPAAYHQMIGSLVLRKDHFDKQMTSSLLDQLRNEIDLLDHKMLKILGKRMRISEKIAAVKQNENLSIFQPRRWDQVIKKALTDGRELLLSENFIRQLLDAIHQESIEHQSKMMNRHNNHQ